MILSEYLGQGSEKFMIHTFSAPELYLLAAAFGGNVLFGLPKKQIYQLQGEEVFAEAHQRLIEKEILTPDGKITNGGAMVIQAIELYYQSEKYVRINYLMFAFQAMEEDEIIALVELDGQEEMYQLRVILKAITLKIENSKETEDFKKYSIMSVAVYEKLV